MDIPDFNLAGQSSGKSIVPQYSQLRNAPPSPALRASFRAGMAHGGPGWFLNERGAWCYHPAKALLDRIDDALKRACPVPRWYFRAVQEVPVPEVDVCDAAIDPRRIDTNTPYAQNVWGTLTGEWRDDE